MSFEQYLDMLGVFFFAISGSLLASRLNFDIVGSVLLGSLTGLGGGVIRDLILGIRPAAFEQPVYLVPAGLAAITVYFLSSHVHRLRRAMLLFDAAGLGVFCVSGTAKALTFGVNPVPQSSSELCPQWVAGSYATWSLTANLSYSVHEFSTQFRLSQGQRQ